MVKVLLPLVDMLPLPIRSVSPTPMYNPAKLKTKVHGKHNPKMPNTRTNLLRGAGSCASSGRAPYRVDPAVWGEYGWGGYCGGEYDG
jgi:hypothetical protein